MWGIHFGFYKAWHYFKKKLDWNEYFKGNIVVGNIKIETYRICFIMNLLWESISPGQC